MMLWRLKQKLSKIERRASPDEALKLEMRSFFQDKGYLLKKETPAITARHFGGVQFAAIAMVVVLLVTIGTSSYAYASDDVLPDSILYPVKQTLENIEERIAVTEAQKEEVIIRHQERRLQEAKVLMDQQKPLPVLHQVLLVEVKKEQQQKGEENKEKKKVLPLVKARLEVAAQGKAVREPQKKREQEKKTKEEVSQDEVRKAKKPTDKRPTQDNQENEARSLLRELVEKQKNERVLREQRRQEEARLRQEKQAAKRRALEEEKKARIEKRAAEQRARAELKREMQIKTQQKQEEQREKPEDGIDQ